MEAIVGSRLLVLVGWYWLCVLFGDGDVCGVFHFDAWGIGLVGHMSELDMRVAIITVPSDRRSAMRDRCISDSRAQLEGDVGAENFRVFVDDEGLGCAENSRRAWRWVAEGDSEWGMVLADDVMGCRDLGAAIGMVFRCKPNYIHSMMDWTLWSQKAFDSGYRWISSGGGTYGGCMAMKRVEVVAMMRWFDRCLGDGVEWPKNHDDTMVAAWAWRAGRKVICSVPTIFQHMEPSESLIGNANQTRICRVSLAPEGSVYDTLALSPDDRVMGTGGKVPRAWVRKNLGV